MNYRKLSKEISFALRHKPCLYKLELDNKGFVTINQLLLSLNETKHYPKEIDYNDLLKVLEISEKQRLEIVGDKIRALYGHTLPMQLEKIPATPPKILYHGTSHLAVEIILKEGLKPMKRQYVHLSQDIDTARLVGRRRDENPVILTIDTLSAIKKGIKFYLGNDKVWLSDSILPEFITILKE